MSGDWPWRKNPYSGKRHVLDWFMWRIAARFPGRWIRLGSRGWRIDNEVDPEDVAQKMRAET